MLGGRSRRNVHGGGKRPVLEAPQNAAVTEEEPRGGNVGYSPCVQKVTAMNLVSSFAYFNSLDAL